MNVMNKVLKLMKEKGVEPKIMARALNMSESGFFNKLQNGGLGTNDAMLICKLLKPENPVSLFFEN